MKKRVMLAMAIIMLLGSVKAMASSVYEENQITKTEAAEADLKQTESIKLMSEIREQIEFLQGKTSSYQEVRIGNDTLSAGQVLSHAKDLELNLQYSFDRKVAEKLHMELKEVCESLQ